MNYKNKEWLYSKYVTEELSSDEIARLEGVGSQTILNWLSKHKIPRRDCHYRRKKVYINTCLNCGKNFEVYSASQHNPNIKAKFKRACSDKCTSEMKSLNATKRIKAGGINYATGPRRTLDRDAIIKLYCYEHKHMKEISKILKVKETILRREFERLSIPREFYRKCPQCNEVYAVPMRSMVDPNSNKFKKFCSRNCFLSSRNQTDTWIEREIRDFLDENDIKYIQQYEIDRMTADFYIPECNLIVEANGDFWHANPEIYGVSRPFHKIHDRVIEKDRRKVRQLTENGYDLIIVWENDLKTKKYETLENLYSRIKGA